MILLCVLILSLSEKIEAMSVLGCNSSGRGGDTAFLGEEKHVGTPGFPGRLEGPFNCIWEIAVDEWSVKKAPILKIHVRSLDMKCSQRNQVWVMVNGRKNFITCDSSHLFFAGGEGSTAEIGLDVQADSSILIAYSAVRTVAEAMKPAPVIRGAQRARSHHQQLNTFANQNDPRQQGNYVQHLNPMVYRPLPPQEQPIILDPQAGVQRPTVMNSLRPRVNLKSILMTLPPASTRLLNPPTTPPSDVETKTTTLSFREKEALEEEKLQRAAKFFYVLGACFVFVIVFFAIKAAFVGSAKPVASTY